MTGFRRFLPHSWRIADLGWLDADIREARKVERYWKDLCLKIGLSAQTTVSKETFAASPDKDFSNSDGFLNKTVTISVAMPQTDSPSYDRVRSSSLTNESSCTDTGLPSAKTYDPKKSGTIVPDSTWNTQAVLAALENMPRPNPTFVARSIKHYPPMCAPAFTPLSPPPVPGTPSVSPMTPQGAFENTLSKSPYFEPQTTVSTNPPFVHSPSASKAQRPQSRKPPPVADIEHVGPVFPTKRAVLMRQSRPYVHAVCGAAFLHPGDVKLHHVGRPTRKVAGCRGKQNGEEIPWCVSLLMCFITGGTKS